MAPVNGDLVLTIYLAPVGARVPVRGPQARIHFVFSSQGIVERIYFLKQIINPHTPSADIVPDNF